MTEVTYSAGALALTAGSKVRVTTTLIPGCAPGDAGTAVLATVLGDGRVLSHAQPDPATAGGVKCFYRHEIEQAG
jgi:hypothetical protein